MSPPDDMQVLHPSSLERGTSTSSDHQLAIQNRSRATPESPSYHQEAHYSVHDPKSLVVARVDPSPPRVVWLLSQELDQAEEQEAQVHVVEYDDYNSIDEDEGGEEQVSSASSRRQRHHDTPSERAPLTRPPSCPRVFKSAKAPILVLGVLAMATVGVLVTLLVTFLNNQKATKSLSATTLHPQEDNVAPNHDPSPDSQARWDAMTKLLEMKGLASASQFLEPTAPHTRTLDWLVYEDQIHTPLDTPLQQGQFVQRYTLILFAFSTGVELWQALNPWIEMVDTHECSFDGVDCNDEGQVVSLQLPHWRLSGSLPEELGRVLTQLTSLILNHNKLDGTIPETLFQLTKLVTLDVYDNNLLSTISPNIGALTNLQVLYLGANRFMGSLPIASLQALSKMEEFVLTENQVTGPIFDAVLTWRHLTSIGLELLPNIEPTTIPTEIGRLTKLQDLILDIVHPGLPTEIGLLTELKILFIGTTVEDDLAPATIPTEIGHLTKLVEFTLNGNRFITGTIPSEMARLTNLDFLDLSTSHLGGVLPTELGLLSNLTVLVLADCQELEGTVPKEFGALARRLRGLALHGTNLQGTLPVEFCRGETEIYARCMLLECDCCSQFTCVP